jgi:hypothetical protein
MAKPLHIVIPHSSRSNLAYGPFNDFHNSQNLCSYCTYCKTFLIFSNRFAIMSISPNVFIYAYL